MEEKFTSATVNRIAVHKLEEMLAAQYNHDFNDKNLEDEQMSREEIRFLGIVSHSAKLVDGHYSLKRPFRKEQFMLPNNLLVAKQRNLGLKRQLCLVKITFPENYSAFSITFVIKRILSAIMFY